MKHTFFSLLWQTSGAKIVSLFTGFDANRHLSDAGTDTIEYARSKSQGEAVTYPEKVCLVSKG